jgi:hypothetical protein
MEGEASAGYLWRVYIHVRRRLETSGLVYGRLWSKGCGGEIGPLLKTGREDDQANAPGQGLWTHLQIIRQTEMKTLPHVQSSVNKSHYHNYQNYFTMWNDLKSIIFDGFQSSM